MGLKFVLLAEQKVAEEFKQEFVCGVDIVLMVVIIGLDEGVAEISGIFVGVVEQILGRFQSVHILQTDGCLPDPGFFLAGRFSLADVFVKLGKKI